MNYHPIKNFTPHAVRVLAADGSELAVIPPSGQVARVSVTLAPAGEIDGLPLVRGTYGEVTGLPDSSGLPDESSTWPAATWIVSRVVAEALRGQNLDGGRGDWHPRLLVPADLVRDASGAVVGCRALEEVA